MWILWTKFKKTKQNELMNHVKEKHDLKVKKCNNFMEGTCIFKEKCWYKH